MKSSERKVMLCLVTKNADPSRTHGSIYGSGKVVSAR